MRDAVIVSAVRTAVGKAPKGTLRDTRPDEMGAAVIKEALRRADGLDGAEVEDVIMGCAMPEAEQGMNVARSAAVRAGMSLIPMGGHIIRPNPYLVEHYPDFYLNMGLATENVARKYEVSRGEQDAFAFQSHRRAAAAQDAGKFDDEIVPLNVAFEELDGRGRKQRREVAFTKDEGVRRDSSEESLAKLRPAFHAQGTITAGNASQMSDGAAAAVVMSGERARELGLKPLGRFVAYATAGCPPEEMGIGPVYAIPKVLRSAGLKLEEIDLIELNEAFAAQSLAVIKTLSLDPEKVNVNGGAIALGHPLGCTGAKLTATVLRELGRRQGRYAMVTMCVGGGMGAAGIFERA
ncbi:MAG: acetyl-CoA C-acyltransferase [Acidobacteria bacterium]|nr:acetyl-CoA C-acyltransferase [Acidobacteriota bacterium]